MKIEILACTPNPEQLIERCGRICYDSFDKMSPPESTQRLITHLIRSGHESVLEHASVTFLVTGVSRALTHQLVRHRIASYSQRSQRYVKETEPNFVIPPSVDDIIGVAYSDFMEKIWRFYNEMLKAGVKPEDARFVLPNACCSEIAITMNFRELRHFFKLRTSKHAQWEIRQMAKEMWKQIVDIAPNVFSDIKFEE
jgi:thymidylate synthase (FAD)